MKLPRAHHLSVEELAGQLLMPVLKLDFLNREAPQTRKILRLIHRYHVGGFVLTGGHPAEVRYWSTFLDGESAIPLLFAADVEQGLSSTVSQGTQFPRPLAFGATQDEALVRNFAEIVARESRALGLNLVFAPALDLANAAAGWMNPNCSWHESAEVAGKLGALFTQTVQKQGIASAARHFPGFGAVESLSGQQLPVSAKNFPELLKADLLPFKQAVQADTRALIVSHILIPGFKYPATMEKMLLKTILRGKWKYEGIILSDFFQRGAMEDYYHPWEWALLPIEAGADMLLLIKDIPLIFHQLAERIRKQESFRKQVEQSVERIFRLKKWIHGHRPKQTHPNRIFKVIKHPNHVGMAREVAEKGIVLLQKSRQFPVNLPDLEEVILVNLMNLPDAIGQKRPFEEELSRIFENLVVVNAITEELLSGSENAARRMYIVSSDFSAIESGASQLSAGLLERLAKSVRTRKGCLVFYLFGNPFAANQLPAELPVDALFWMASAEETSQQAAARAVAGFLPINGTLPVTLRKDLNRSIKLPANRYVLTEISRKNAASWKTVDGLIAEAIESRIFPGASLVVAVRGKILLEKAYGHFEYDATSLQVRPETVFDLASLTRVLATVPVYMKLLEDGTVRLSDNLCDYYPQLRGDLKCRITIADLLAHQSGLPAHKPLYDFCSTREEIIQAILETKLEFMPGERSMNSDLGYILLYDIAEKIVSGSFDAFCRDIIFQPLGLRSLRFNPSEDEKAHIPPTGEDRYRKRIIQGEVNDTLCYVMGGVSGHAGLFGNARDVAAMGQLVVQAGIYNSDRRFRPSTVEFFTRPFHPKISARTPGWETPKSNNSCGKYFSHRSVGLTGFTGTSLWVDIKREVVVAFLSNRVHPDPYNNDIVKFRPRLHDAVMKLLLKK